MNASYYKRWVEGQGGTIFTARAIRQQGIEPMVAAALEIAGRDTDAIYVTVDIDASKSATHPARRPPPPTASHRLSCSKRSCWGGTRR